MTSESATIEMSSDGAPVVDTGASDAFDGGDRRRSRPKPTPMIARPAKFLADLTRAMRAAALAERDELLAGHQAEATAYLEQLRSESTERASTLRRTADDDIVAVRDWSKAELARIREETDRRIAARRAELEGELEEETSRATHAAATVDERVEAYRTEMERFFERLLTIEDPATFAALAANLPEPPPFDAAAALAAAQSASAEVARASRPATKATVEPETAAEPKAIDLPEPVAEAEPVAAVQAEPAAADIEPAVETEVAANAGATSDTQPELAPAGTTQPAPDADRADESDSTAPDPRVAALSLMPDFAAAESEAGLGLDPLAFLGPTTATASASAEPAPAQTVASSGEIVTSRLVVTGLVSVAGVAAFKRQVARRPGVQSVAVTSGPDGEFVFTVVHHEGVDLQGAIATLEGFDAVVTGSSDDAISVTARDPEAAA